MSDSKQYYPYIWAWGARLGSYSYYMKEQSELAKQEQQPETVIYCTSGYGPNGEPLNPHWSTLDELHAHNLSGYRALVKTAHEHFGGKCTCHRLPLNDYNKGMRCPWCAARLAKATTRLYRVEFTGGAWVTGTVTVQASTEDEAKEKALAKVMAGDIVWDYNEYMDSVSPEIKGVQDA